MKNHYLTTIITLFIFAACNTKNESTNEMVGQTDHDVEQVLNDEEQPTDTLPNYQTPAIIYLKDRPAPRKVQVLPTQPSTANPQPQGHFTTYTTDNGLALDAISCSFIDNRGNLWFGTNGGGVSKYDGKSFETFSTSQGLANNLVLSITQDNRGNLWFGTYGGGVSKYDGKSFETFSTSQGLANNVVSSITEDNRGNLWFGTYGGGVSKYDGKSFETFSTSQGLANNVVSSITEDNRGNLWFGTNGGGVSKYDGKSFETFSTSQGLANNVVFSITEDNRGNLWFGTAGGLAFLPKPSELAVATKLNPNGTKNNTSSPKVIPMHGFITIGTVNGLPDDFITQVLQGADGKMYIGTNYGIASFDIPTQAEINAYLAGLNPNSETRNSKLETRNFKLNNLEIYNSATHFPLKDVNAGQNAMYQDSKGIIWAGTGSDKTALVRFNPKAVNKPKTPPTTVIQSIKVLGENVCWYNIKSEVGRPKPEVGGAKTEFGGAKTEEKPLRNSADSSVFSAVNSLSQDSMAMLLAQFHAFGKPVSQDVLDSQYTKYKDIQFDGITNWYPLPQNLELPHQYNSISFDYVANELSRNHLVRYQYMLEGQDENWSPITAKNDVSYTNLFEGNYTFKIKAQYTGPGNNNWSELTTFSFKVLPPWYRTWWAYTIYVILTVCVIWLIVWWNGKKLRARAEQLKEEVKKATKEIVEQKKVVEEKHKEITDSINYAERIQHSFLATTEMLDQHLKNYFVFFRPKDVVSGDFYWAAELNNGNFAFSVADSTGHGVPGAIMSILNISSLEKSIEKYSEPDAILNETRKIIIERLKKDGSIEGGKDGMDCSLLVLNQDKSQLTFAAANNPVFIVRNNALLEFKPNKMPVGKHDKDHENFTLQTVQLQKGDIIYTLTDGFTDQFGGSKGKKYMIKNLKEFLLKISALTLLEQEQKLSDEFKTWKGENEQVDDVCIIGVKI